MEKINIAEILKDCPTGMELDSPVWNNIVFKEIDGDNIVIFRKSVDSKVYLTQYGELNTIDGNCVIFPKGKTTWKGFQKPFKDGDIVAFDNPHRVNLQVFIFKNKKENSTLSSCYLMLDGDELVLEEGMYYVTRLATEEEKQELFDAIKDNGYKWNAETKTLEKLKKDKFDISTLKPFDKVLVRDAEHNKWNATLFSYYNTEKQSFYVASSYYAMCIPFEGNEHLLGTTDDCDEFYKTW